MKRSDIKYFLTLNFLTVTTQKRANFVRVNIVLHFIIFFIIFQICTVQWLNCPDTKNELNWCNNGGGYLYLLQSVAIHFNHTLLNKKIMFMMALYKMYVLFYCIFYYQNFINYFQRCQRYYWIINSENDWVGMWSCCWFRIYFTTWVNNHFAHLIMRINFVIWRVNLFTDMSHMWWQFLVVDNKNNYYTCHSKLFDLFNNKSKIMFLSQQTLRFAESRLFDDQNGAYYFWITFSSSLIDMSLVSLTEWIDVKSASFFVLSELILLSSHVWWITSAEFWWDDIYSLIFLSSIFKSLILVLYDGVYFRPL